MSILKLTLVSRGKMDNNIILATIVGIVVNTFGEIFKNIIKATQNVFTNLLAYIKDKILCFVYGPARSFSSSIHCGSKNMYPTIAYDFIKYVSGETGIDQKTFMFSHRKNMPVFKGSYFGNYKLNVTLFSEQNEKKNDTSYLNTATFYSRMHTKEEFDKLIQEFVKNSFNVYTENTIVKYSSKINDRMIRYAFTLKDTKQSELFFNKNEYNLIKNFVLNNPRGNFLLHGPPGTGKTSLIKTLSQELNAIIHIINLKDIKTIDELRAEINIMNMDAIDPVKDEYCFIKTEKKFVLFEDFDTMLERDFWNSKTKDEGDGDTKNKKDKEDEKDKDNKSIKKEVGYSFTDILNLLDGVIPLTSYTFWTTNHLEIFNPSLYRPGRMNYSFLISDISQKEFDEYIQKEYKIKNLMPVPKGLTVSSIYHASYNNKTYKSFVKAIKKL